MPDSQEEILDAFLSTLPDPPAPSPTATELLEARYLQRDPGGRVVETIEELWIRVASHVAGAETDPEARAEWTERFRRLMEARVLLPNSPTLMNAGLGGGQLAACFVLPVEDSISEIFDAIRDMALVQKTGGGTGFSFSRLRPAGDVVASTQGRSSGPLTFLEVFNAATDSIRQGGRRRGANMGVLEVHHPDILRFITSKLVPGRLSNFNLSVGLTAAFWKALEAGRQGADGHYSLINPRSGETVAQLQADRVLGLLARCAWHGGEPGVLFLDRINEDNPTPELGDIASTNPCGELPLLPWESCTLGSLNLARFVVRGKKGEGQDAPDIHWEGLGAAVQAGIRMLDDIIDATTYPLAGVASATRATRKVGLGLMGFADLLIELGIPYGQEASLALAQRLMAFVAHESFSASEALARERGPFPAFATSRLAAQGVPMRRNATTNTIAPTGSISILAGSSAGIEPLFAPAYRRRFLDGREATEVHPLFARALVERGVDDPAVIHRVASAGHARVDGVPAELAELFVTAHQVPPERHVQIQAAFQRHVDNAVSKTVNLPREATPGDVEEIFRLARRLGCKGVTVYRDGSRKGQVLSFLPDQGDSGVGTSDKNARLAFDEPGALPGDAGALPGGLPGQPASYPFRAVLSESFSDFSPCPECGAAMELTGPFRVCYACAHSA